MLSDTVKNGQKGASKTSSHPKLKIAQNNLEKSISKSYQKDMPSLKECIMQHIQKMLRLVSESMLIFLVATFLKNFLFTQS